VSTNRPCAVQPVKIQTQFTDLTIKFHEFPEGFPQTLILVRGLGDLPPLCALPQTLLHNPHTIKPAALRVELCRCVLIRAVAAAVVMDRLSLADDAIDDKRCCQ